MALNFWPVAAPIQPFDCLHSPGRGVLRGVSDARAPMRISSFSFRGLAVPPARLTVFGLALCWRRGYEFGSRTGCNGG